MAFITLTTDLGLKDHYVSSIKATILTQLPEVHIVDISHEIAKFNIIQAAVVVKNAYREFPPGSTHIIGVLPEERADSPHLAILYDGHYFVGADNGVFSLIFDQVPDKLIHLNLKLESNNFTFPTKDVFAHAACHLARGGTLEMLGQPVPSLTERIMPKPVGEPNHIRGSVIYVDSYGNVVTNITQQMFKEIGRGRPYSISLRRGTYEISDISQNYFDVEVGERLALFGNNGLLEVAISYGNANQLLGLNIDDMVTIEFS